MDHPLTPALADPAAALAGATALRGMERLLQAVQELSLARELAQVQAIVRRAARELTGCDGATFVLRDGGQCYYADEDAIAPLWKGLRFPLESCISGWTMLHRQPAVIPDIYLDPRIPHEAYRPTFVKSLVMVPIRTLDPIGAIGSYWAQQRQPTETEVWLLQALADSTSVAMANILVHQELEQRVRERTAALERANAEIQQLSLTDDLTGLYNRRGFFLLAEQEVRKLRRSGEDCVFLYADLDGLKRTNDTLGHDAGDQMIEDAASLLRRVFRKADIVARMGGDEFCVMAPMPDQDAAGLTLRLLEALAAFNRDGLRPYPLSMSIGTVTTHLDGTANIETLIARADEAMYEQKRRRAGARLRVAATGR